MSTNGDLALVPTNQLVPHPDNPRQGDVGAIIQSIEANGWYGTIVAQRGSNRILAGNHRVQAAHHLGIHEVPVYWVDVDDERARRILLADNRTNDLASYDEDALAGILQELAHSPDGLEGTGYDGDDLDDLLQTLGYQEHDGPLVDPKPTVPEEALALWQVKPGDLWQAGDQHVYCGDATSLVTRVVLDLLAVDAVWTDPPYGVSYQMDLDPDEAKRLHRRTDGLEVSNDNFTSPQLIDLIREAVLEAPLRDGASIYVAAPSGPHLAAFLEPFVASSWLRQCLIWEKQQMAFGRSDYHYQHEMILYGWKPGAAHSWYGDRKQTSVLAYPRPHVSPEHPTMKPVDLIAHCLRNSTKPGDTVYDPFVGSGSTLLACHQLGRQGRGVDIDPKYVAVTLSRLQALGLDPARVDNGH